MIFQKFLKTVFCLLMFCCAKAQNFSNKGTEFWVGYGFHQVMVNGLSNQNAQDMVLYFTSDLTAKVTVEIPAIGWKKNYTVFSNSVTESDPMPKTAGQDARLSDEGIFKTGIHITSDNPIVAYAHIYDRSVSGATLLFPVATLGREYYSLNFTQKSNQPKSNSWAYAVATEDNTSVEITPSANTLSHRAGETFVVTLNKGEIYNLMGTTSANNGVDLTGTRIRSVSTGANGCKKIAVFSGSGRLSVNCDDAVTTSDNVVQQVFPRDAWGRKYLTVPTSKLPNNYFRIAVSDPTTVVAIDGVRATKLINNFYYEFLANSPKSIVADKQIMVAQYITSTSDATEPTCGNLPDGIGDPEMIYLSPTEQTIDKVTLNSTKHYQITSHFVNVVIKSRAVSSFTVDGVAASGSFTTHPGDPSYSYAVLPLKEGSHTLAADSGFNAIAYGYGQAESYGYNAGTNIKDLYRFLTLRNQYATVNVPTTCKNVRFFFSVTLPYKASALTWDFNTNPNLTPNQTVSQSNPAADSTYQYDGKTLYVYSLPLLYAFSATGSYPIKIIANNQTSEGCNGTEEIPYDIQVVEPPVTDFSFTSAGCTGDLVYFQDASNTNGRVLKKWQWDFADGTADSISNPHKAFNKAGTFSVKETAINDIGCASAITKPVTISPKPVSRFTLSNQMCQGAAVTLTDKSTITTGAITRWHWDFGDGTTQYYVNGNPFDKIYNAAGSYNISLVVEGGSGCKSDSAKQSVTINPLPVANFTLPRVCENDPFAAFTDSSYVPGNGSRGFTYLWNFGDAGSTAANPNTSSQQNPKHKYAAAGNYIASLTVTSTAGCAASVTKPFTVNSGSPKTDFALVGDPVLCSSARIGIKNNSSVEFGTVNKVEIAWNSQNSPSTIETDDTPFVGKKYYHTFPQASEVKTYQVKMISYSGASCFSEKVIPVTVNPSPAVTFSAVPGICLNDPARQITEAKETSGVTGSFAFYGRGITSAGVINPAAAGPGTTTVKYVFTSAAGCSDSAIQTINVTPNPVVNPSSAVYVLEGGSAVLNPSITGTAVKYLWTPGTYLNNPSSKNPETSPKDSITYKLSVTSQGGCEGSGKIRVLVLKGLAVPNAFSPNGDGINDTWNIASLASYPNCTVHIFNRYGTVVYLSAGYSKPWSGTFNGNPLPGGVYYYIIDPKNGKKPYTGYVTILR